MGDDRSQGLQALGALPVDAETLFPEPRGASDRRRNTRRAERLASARSVLERALEPGERIRFSLPGIRFFPLEYFLSGMIASRLTNAQTLVLTDRRLLLIQTDRRGRPADIKNAVPLAHVRAVKQALGRVNLELADGETLGLIGLGRDAKRLAALVPASPRARTVRRAIVQLCPQCLRPTDLASDEDTSCPGEVCRIPFRSPRRAARMSLVLPGLGNLYLRHRLFGILELFASTLALLLAIYFFGSAMVRGGGALSAFNVGMGWFLVMVPRALAYTLTLHMGRKGIVPLATRPAGSDRPARLPFFPRWAHPLFGAIAVVLAVGTVVIVPRAGTQMNLFLAIEAAQAGDLAAAMRFYDSGRELREPSDHDLFSLAVALFEKGDFRAGASVLSQLRNRELPPAETSRLNEVMARFKAQRAAYDRARAQLRSGEVEEGLAALETALPALQWMKRPRYPATRDEAVMVAVKELIVQETPTALSRADRLLPLVSAPPLAAPAAVARAFIAAMADDHAAARAELGRLDDVTLEADWEYLRLEVRALLAEADELPALLQELERMWVTAQLDERRVVLLTTLRSEVVPGERVLPLSARPGPD